MKLDGCGSPFWALGVGFEEQPNCCRSWASNLLSPGNIHSHPTSSEKGEGGNHEHPTPRSAKHLFAKLPVQNTSDLTGSTGCVSSVVDEAESVEEIIPAVCLGHFAITTSEAESQTRPSFGETLRAPFSVEGSILPIGHSHCVSPPKQQTSQAQLSRSNVSAYKKANRASVHWLEKLTKAEGRRAEEPTGKFHLVAMSSAT